MSFEDHIRKNKESFKVKNISPELWDKIDKNLILNPKRKNKSRTLIITLLSSAAVGLLVFFAWQNYNQNQLLYSTQQELAAMKSTMNELFLDQSSFKRIKAVSMSNEFEQPDNEIINALTNTMLFDENENVKLAAVNALEKFADTEEVKLAFIRALDDSNEAFFQIKIINILSDLKEERVLPLLNHIIDDKASHGFLKDEAITARQSIKSL